MIKFRKIRYKNFKSVGNTPVEIELDQHKTTLISGSNGAGKTTILEAICFVLFNKPYSNVNKPQLVNSINQKQCEVTVEFDTNGKEYKVIRGIKPNTFEIYENEVLLNQDSSSRDYQKVLEKQILKMNHRAFTQVVVLGSGYYVPFMELTALQRRDFIEDLLDIRVFSVMKILNSEKLKVVKDQLKDAESKIDHLKEKCTMQKNFIDRIVQDNSSASGYFEQQINEATESKITLNDQNTLLQIRIDELKDLILSFNEKIKVEEEKIEEIEDLEDKVSAIQREIDRQKKQEVCHYCKQDICEDHKQKIIDTLDAEQVKLNTSLMLLGKDKVQESLQALLEIKDNLNIQLKEKMEEQLNVSTDLRVVTNSIDNLNRQLTALNNLSNVDEEKEKLNVMSAEALVWVKRKKEFLADKEHHVKMSDLLQDDGIKSQIIKKYIPAINNLINKYLNELDFFVSFTLDENFNEKVLSRHRDTFSWDCFSEGQKLRISIALTFAWREIAKMKNSVDTNILFMDEILDSSLDSTGVELFMDLLTKISISNIFIISHRQIEDMFDHHIQFRMKNNFTEIV